MKPFFHSQINSVVQKQIVLSIEDNDADFVIIEMALKRCLGSITIWRAADGEQAIDFLEKSEKLSGDVPLPDLIVLDANMPRRDGFEVLRYISSTEESIRKIPIIMFTSSASFSDMRHALDLGAREFVTKTSDVDQVLDALSKACWKHLQKPESQKEP